MEGPLTARESVGSVPVGPTRASGLSAPWCRIDPHGARCRQVQGKQERVRGGTRAHAVTRRQDQAEETVESCANLDPQVRARSGREVTRDCAATGSSNEQKRKLKHDSEYSNDRRVVCRARGAGQPGPSLKTRNRRNTYKKNG